MTASAEVSVKRGGHAWSRVTYVASKPAEITCCARVVLPDCRGPLIITTGVSDSASTRRSVRFRRTRRGVDFAILWSNLHHATGDIQAAAGGDSDSPAPRRKG